MFDHVTIRVSDREASQAFYSTVLRTLGIGHSHAGPDFAERDVCSLAAADSDRPVFHRALTEAGHRDNGAPGERPVYHAGYSAAYVLDPDGNNVELVNHNRG